MSLNEIRRRWITLAVSLVVFAYASRITASDLKDLSELWALLLAGAILSAGELVITLVYWLKSRDNQSGRIRWSPIVALVALALCVWILRPRADRVTTVYTGPESIVLHVLKCEVLLWE